MSFTNCFLPPDSGDWTEALFQSLDDFPLQQGLFAHRVNECVLARDVFIQ